MKIIKILSLVFVTLLVSNHVSQAQNLNWANLQKEQRHILKVNVGFDYAFTYGIGYGYQLKTKFPVLLNVEHSQPAGHEIFDDFKTKIGGQMRVYQVKDFHFTAKIQGVFRRYENDYVRLVNFGSDMSAVVGYYKQKWFVAGEFGFDKAIVTNFKHSGVFREDFPQVKDGWYEPSTGGNFYFGAQAGLSFNKSDLTFEVGKVIQQDFATSPTIPLYFQLCYNRKF